MMTKMPKRGMRPRITNKLPQVRLRRAWRQYPAGAVIRPPGTLRQVLEQTGIGEVVEETEETLDTASQSEAPKPKRRRGRPKKVQEDESGEPTSG